VVGIADGDTLPVLESSNQQHKVRLYGIDAPEKKQPFGTRSKQNLSALAFGKSATVDYAKRDRYARIVGKVIVGGQDVGLRQVQAGQEAARAAHLGLWRDGQSVPPWEYRHQDVLRAGYR
jgi:endonuclease YncB( thermonuclease family)